MMPVQAHTLLDVATETVAVCSVLHTVLPPWDAFDDFPTIQKYYKLFIYIIGYMALNARSAVNPKISIHNPSGPNANVPIPNASLVASPGDN